MKKLFMITASISMLFLAWCQNVTINPSEIPEWSTWTIEQITGSTIQSFEDCLKAGFPIMESYPRQCNDWNNTYVEEIQEDINIETTTWEAITWEIITGQEIWEYIQELQQTWTQEDSETWTNLILLQAKLKAMMERRNQQTLSWTNTITWTTDTNITTQPTTNTTNEEVTEQDIENLENIIDEIIKQ